MKEHKEVKLSFDVINKRIKNFKIDGNDEDLILALSHDEKTFHMCMSVIMDAFLSCPDRNRFLASFFNLASDLETSMLHEMSGKVS